MIGYNKEKKEETNIIYLPFVWFVKWKERKMYDFIFMSLYKIEKM